MKMEQGNLVRLNQEYGKAAAYIYKIKDVRHDRVFLIPVRTIARNKPVTSMGVIANLCGWYSKRNLIVVEA